METPNRPRVLVVIDTLGPGGAEESMKAMLPLVRTFGVDVEVGILRSIAPEREEALRERGVPVTDIGPAVGPVGVAKALRRAIRERQPDLLHVTLFDPVVGGAVIGRLTGTPVLASIVNTPPDTGANAPKDTAGSRWKVRALRHVEAFVCRHLVTQVHAVTPGVRDAVIDRFGVRADRVTVSPRGRDPKRFHPASAEERAEARAVFDLADGDEVVVALARHEPSKGLVDLADAAAVLRERRPAAKVLIGGRDGSQTEALVDRIRTHGLGGTVVLLGDRPDPERILAAADLFVLASRREGTSGATIEAMAAGLPIVATDVSGLTGITVDDVNAVIVPIAQPDRLGEAMADLLDDPDAARRLGAGALETFRTQFDLEQAARSMAEMYQRAAAKDR